MMSDFPYKTLNSSIIGFPSIPSILSVPILFLQFYHNFITVKRGLIIRGVFDIIIDLLYLYFIPSFCSGKSIASHEVLIRLFVWVLKRCALKIS